MSKHPIIVIDGVFFQFAKTGIARLWRSFLTEWSQTDFAEHLIILDRNFTAPRITGLTYRDVPAFEGFETGKEALRLEEWCQELKADLFVSTYYTTPIATRSAVMVYDMIHELLNSDGGDGTWPVGEKSFAFLHADQIVAISHNTAADILKLSPQLANKKFSVVHCGVDSMFSPRTQNEIDAVKKKFEITKPYCLLVGTREGFNGYKNGAFLVRAIDQMADPSSIEVICVGGEHSLGALAKFKNASVRLLHYLSEDDLIALYSGAMAMVYPSKYEGFGLPIIEAMACGCPVITCPNGSIPEVAGDAALFVENDNIEGMQAALKSVIDAEIRVKLRSKGLERAKQFSWKKAADEFKNILLDPQFSSKNAEEVKIWEAFRQKESRLSPVLKYGRVPRKRIVIKLGKFSLHLGISRQG